MDVTIKYKDAVIAEMSDSGQKTLTTCGKYCEGDIIVQYDDPEKPTQEKTITPSETAQDVTPDSGKVLSKVSVGAIPKTYVGSSVPRKSEQTYTPKTYDQTIAAGQYLTDAQTVKGDANLSAENIKNGVSLFGVTGTHEGQKEEQSKTVTPTAAGFTVSPDSGKVLSSVVVKGDGNLYAENVREGISIFGVAGTLKEGITPSGMKSITENGTHDVTEYESVDVNVSEKPTQFTNLLESDKVTITLNTASNGSNTVTRNGVFMVQLNLNDFPHMAGVKKTQFRWRGIYPDPSYVLVQQSSDGVTWIDNISLANYTVDEYGDPCLTMTNNYPTAYPHIRMSFRRLNAAMSSKDNLKGCILTAFEPIGNGGYTA